MIRLPRLTPRQVLIVLHDLLATAAAIGLTFVMRFEDYVFFLKLPGLEIFLPFFLVYAVVVYFIFGLHRNKWRFTSVPDLTNIVRAATWAKENGLPVISMTGFSGGRSAKIADANLHVTADNYGVIEDVHQSLMHILAQYVRQAHMDEAVIRQRKF